MKNRVRLLAQCMFATALAVSGCGGAAAGSKDLLALLALVSPPPWAKTATTAPQSSSFYSVDEHGGYLYAAGSIMGKN